MTEKLTYKPVEAADILGLSLPVIYTLCKRPDFPSLHIGRSILIPRQELEEWIRRESSKT